MSGGGSASATMPAIPDRISQIANSSIPDNLAAMTVLDADLQYLASKGVSGVRIFPNWQAPGETLMQCDGALRPLQLEKLTRLIDRAAANGLVVDVSFTIDTVTNTDG